MPSPEDQILLDALRAGRTFETGGSEARDHESYEWSLEVSYESETFIVKDTTSAHPTVVNVPQRVARPSDAKEGNGAVRLYGDGARRRQRAGIAASRDENVQRATEDSNL